MMQMHQAAGPVARHRAGGDAAENICGAMRKGQFGPAYTSGPGPALGPAPALGKKHAFTCLTVLARG